MFQIIRESKSLPGQLSWQAPGVPKAIREFGRKYSEDYASFAVTIINQSYLARMDNITFLPAYLF